MDRCSRKVRSYVKSRIRGVSTRPELVIRRLLWEMGFRGYRLHVKALPGNPDLVFRKRGVVIFVDGCFWHCCLTCGIPTPSSQREYWNTKLVRNKLRDCRINRRLRASGWRVIRICEREVLLHQRKSMRRIASALGGNARKRGLRWQ